MRMFLRSVAGFAFLLVGSTAATSAEQIVEPGGTPEDAQMALSNPDEFAWRLFLYINRQALPGSAGQADPSKGSVRDYGPDKDVVWETWALASGLVVAPSQSGLRYVDNKSEVFKRPATLPVEWDKLDRAGNKPVLSANLQGLFPALDIAAGMKPGGSMTFAAPAGVPAGDEEVRMNRSTYEAVRSKRLYSIEGLDDAVAAAKAAGKASLAEFEPSAKEVKAQWIRLTSCTADKPCADKDRFHWRVIVNPENNVPEVWGLASLHVITKDLKNWFWADFGHIDCETGAGPCSDFSADEGNVLRDSTTNGPDGKGASGSMGVRNETVKSKWEFYRLRGTQIDFVTAQGLPTILSNPVIESSFQKSSCMTCHAYATAGIPGSVPDEGTSLPRFLGFDFVRNIGSSAPPRPDVGAPVCGKFFNKSSGFCPDAQSPDKPLYFQTDFLWDMPFRAFSEK
ncbi:hypothetical protein ACVDG8_014610 [Mesorhizobium sp. ORM8.1]